MPHSDAHHDGHRHQPHACNATHSTPHRFESNRRDPTRTATIRKRYSAQLYKRYRAIQMAVTEYVGRRDILGLSSRPGLNSRYDMNVNPPSPGGVPNVPPPKPSYDFPTKDERIRRFREWLESSSDAVVLGSSGPSGNVWTDDYIRYAYGKGATQADAKLRAAGYTVPDLDLTEAFQTPIHQDTLSLFYRRQYDGLRGINDAMGKDVSRVLTESFLAGENPMDAARTINQVVSNVGINRARTLAHTEMIWTHSESTLNRFEQVLGSGGQIRLMAEWITAGDDRVCPECESLEGELFTVAEARNLIPLHPRCRCSWLPARIDPVTGEVIYQ